MTRHLMGATTSRVLSVATVVRNLGQRHPIEKQSTSRDRRCPVIRASNDRPQRWDRSVYFGPIRRRTTRTGGAVAGQEYGIYLVVVFAALFLLWYFAGAALTRRRLAATA